MRYVVPYSAPGIKWGQLRIDAESPADALARAEAIHASTIVLYRMGGGAESARMTLRKRERSQIVYGEPSPGFWLSPSVPASWPASSNVAQTEGR